ncbi:MAG: glutathione S-transferase [Rhodobacteraceae bacterium]|nr:glutathione S-transferase [Paracoccaceae bacterium]
MTYDLYIGDRMFSSWSLRGKLMLAGFGLPHRTHETGLYSGTLAHDLLPLHPARLVPVLRCPDGTIIGETMAIAETLAEDNPAAGLWPDDRAARATARWLCAEMSSGFQALRDGCPMQMMHCHVGFNATAPVRADLARLETLWAHARQVSGASEGWLFGAYSLADVFFTPVAARIVGYDLPVSDGARAYCTALLAHEEVREWRRLAVGVHYDPVPHALNLPNRPWPL